MANSNPISTREIVDRIVGELSQDFSNKFKEVNNKKGFNWNGTIDFSDLTDKIMAVIENGQEKDIGLVIDTSVATKLKKWLDAINPSMKKVYSHILQEIAGEMVSHARKSDKIFADMITDNINKNREEKSNKQSFRQGLSNFKSENEGEPSVLSIEEALQKNAQQLYERTGEVPNGYALGKDGQVFKEAGNDEEITVNQRTDVENVRE